MDPAQVLQMTWAGLVWKGSNMTSEAKLTKSRKKYSQSDIGKAAHKRYAKTEKGRVSRNKANQKYRNTLAGRAAVMCATKRLYCKKNNIPFDLTTGWYMDKLRKGCELTGIAFSYTTDAKVRPTSPSVDRISRDRGYLMNNCRMILYAVNMFRGAGTDGEMYYIAQALLSPTKF
jgi:hypothetical protein